MSKLSLLEINQSQLDTTPVIDGQLIVCLDTGNAYRDSTVAHVKIGSDLKVVSELPLAPLAGKIYLKKPNELYSYAGGVWTLLNEECSISANKSAANGDVKIMLDGAKQSSVAVKGSGVTTVMTNEEGELVIDTKDPSIYMERMTNTEIDAILAT